MVQLCDQYSYMDIYILKQIFEFIFAQFNSIMDGIAFLTVYCHITNTTSLYCANNGTVTC